jgi:hypothetical protein
MLSCNTRDWCRYRDFLVGDANCDDRVTAADIVALEQYIDWGVGPQCGADTNDDGVLDEVDVQNMPRLIFAQ